MISIALRAIDRGAIPLPPQRLAQME
jgi:hypothetical protein